MATVEHESMAEEKELASCLKRLRLEINAFQQDLTATSGIAGDGYQKATQIDILVNRFLRLTAGERDL